MSSLDPRVRDASVPLERVAETIILLWVEVSVAVEHYRHRRVAGEHGHLLGMSTFGNPQRDGGVTEIVDAQGRGSAASTAGIHDRRRNSVGRTG
jgi:hypothetical protein